MITRIMKSLVATIKKAVLLWLLNIIFYFTHIMQ